VRLPRVRIIPRRPARPPPRRQLAEPPAQDHNVRCVSRRLCRVTVANTTTTDWVAHNVPDPTAGQVIADQPIHRVVIFEAVSVAAAPKRR
jgi:hypothetical protein